jgi:hypothetical protein
MCVGCWFVGCDTSPNFRGRSLCEERLSFSPERPNDFREADDPIMSLNIRTGESNEDVNIFALG